MPSYDVQHLSVEGPHLLKEAEKVVHRGHVCAELQLAHFLWTRKSKNKATALLQGGRT